MKSRPPSQSVPWKKPSSQLKNLPKPVPLQEAHGKSSKRSQEPVPSQAVQSVSVTVIGSVIVSVVIAPVSAALGFCQRSPVQSWRRFRFHGQCTCRFAILRWLSVKGRTECLEEPLQESLCWSPLKCRLESNLPIPRRFGKQWRRVVCLEGPVGCCLAVGSRVLSWRNAEVPAGVFRALSDPKKSLRDPKSDRSSNRIRC